MNLKYNSRVFYVEHDDAGGAVPADLVPAPEFANEPVTPTATEPVKVEPPAAPMVDAAALAEKFGAQIAQHFPKAQAPAMPQMSPEEAKKLLNVWEPTEEWMQKYDNLETRKAAIAEMRDGQMRQADTIAQIRLAEMQKSLDERYAPVMRQFEAQQAREREQRFFAAHPDISKPELQPLVMAVGQQLIQSGKQFSSEKELFDAVANGVVSVIRTTNPDYKPNSATVAKPSGGGIAVTTPGAGGGGGMGSAPTPKSTLARILPKVRT